jgi:hypothetical protein
VLRNADRTDPLRRVFRAMNRLVLLMWRLGLGRMMAGARRGYVMVLVTTGRRTRRRRLAPVNFDEEPGFVYCLAGFGRRTHWLINLLGDPACEVWLPDGRRLAGNGEVVVEEPERIALIRRLLVRAGFATRLAEPGVDPRKAPDAVIAELGDRYGGRYEVVRITLEGPVIGPGGPGDLKWIGVTAVLAVVAVVARRRR